MAKQITSFKGFKTKKYPVYTVVTPCLGATFDIRTAKVREIASIKESIVTNNRISEIITTMLWQCIDKCPDFIRNEEDFIKYTPLRDRDALIYGLNVITYGNERPFLLSCYNCNFEETVKLDLTKSFTTTMYPGAQAVINSYKVEKNINKASDPEVEAEIKKRDEILKMADIIKKMPEDLARDQFPEYFKYLEEEKTKEESGEILHSYDPTLDPESLLNKRFRVELPTSKNIVAYIKTPVILDERTLTRDLSLVKNTSLDMAMETLFVDKFEEYDPETNELVQTVTDRISILEAYGDIEDDDRKKLIEEYKDNFGKYKIDVISTWNCKNSTNCGKENRVEFDPVTDFFRTITKP